jgi:CheY-like chemotaxis protein
VLGRLLRSLGHDVTVKHSAAAAIQTIEKDSFDLLLADIGLPDATGWDLMRRVQSIRPIPGIALSGFVSDEDSQRSLDAGFLCHLRKPISIQQLASKLAQYLTPTTAV